MSDEQLSFFDLVYNVRAMRRIKSDPVPLALMMKVLNAGVQAPSGQNLQPWKFVLISDEEKKLWFAQRYTQAVSYTHLPSPRDRTRSRMPSSA